MPTLRLLLKCSMVQSQSKPITLNEFLKQPETKPAQEYIDGQIIQKPVPKGKHSTIQTELSTTINITLKPRKIEKNSALSQSWH